MGSVEIEEQDSEIVEINFSTAWSPPEAICIKLREMFPDLSFSWFFMMSQEWNWGYL